jgi:hypothetical protein
MLAFGFRSHHLIRTSSYAHAGASLPGRKAPCSLCVTPQQVATAPRRSHHVIAMVPTGKRANRTYSAAMLKFSSLLLCESTTTISLLTFSSPCRRITSAYHGRDMCRVRRFVHLERTASSYQLSLPTNRPSLVSFLIALSHSPSHQVVPSTSGDANVRST